MSCLLRCVEILGDARACSLTRFLGFSFLLQLISEIYRNAQVHILRNDPTFFNGLIHSLMRCHVEVEI